MGTFNADGTEDFLVTAQLNAPLDPERRLRHFEEPLLAAFATEFPGSRIEEGRTLVDAADQPQSADLEMVVRLDPEAFDTEVDRLVALFNRLGTPRGSRLAFGELEDADEVAIGEAEGIVVVVPHTADPAEDQPSALEAFAPELKAALASDERVLGVQEASGDTRIHVYAPDVAALADRVGAVVDASAVPGISLLPIVGEEAEEWVAVDVEPTA